MLLTKPPKKPRKPKKSKSAAAPTPTPKTRRTPRKAPEHFFEVGAKLNNVHPELNDLYEDKARQIKGVQ